MMSDQCNDISVSAAYITISEKILTSTDLVMQAELSQTIRF